MYLSYFGLTERPFAITPDPRFLYLSDRHREALSHLLYGLGEHGGFVQLTGEVGTGKTTLCRSLLERLPAEVDVALLLNSRLSAPELLASLCDELRIEYPAGTTSIKVLVDALYRHLLDAHARGRRTVLIVDEAQNLGVDALEQIRMLTNLETPREKLLQIILIGQPELAKLLQRQDLRQLAQRITARYHLMPFSAQETRAYVLYRMQVAGQADRVFEDGALAEIYARSGGIPRLINILCDRALLGAYATRRSTIDARVVRRAADEALGFPEFPTPAPRRRTRVAVPAIAAGTVVAAVVLVVAVLPPPWLGDVVASARRAIGRSPAPVSAAPTALPESVAPTPPTVSAAATPPPVSAAPPAPSVSAAPTARLAVTKPIAPAAADAPAAATVTGAVEPARPEAAAATGRGARDAVPSRDPVAVLEGVAAADRAAAFSRLYALWGVEFRETDPRLACEAPRGTGLRCFSAQGPWHLLRRLDMPAVLELLTPTGERRYAVLTALDGDRAVLEVGDDRHTVLRSEVDRLWRGVFTILWRRPAVGAVPMELGTQGPGVAWLRQRLAEVAGTPQSPAPSQLYDDDLRRQVMEFQLSQFLDPDGIVGDQTLIRLAAALDSRTPSLAGARPQG